MKIAKVIPLFKKGEVFDAGNYRPISLLSSLSKILERLIFIRTTNFLMALSHLDDLESVYADVSKISLKRWHTLKYR